MSGNPIIQDGKLVGEVTHVLVNDLTRGYGVFNESQTARSSEVDSSWLGRSRIIDLVGANVPVFFCDFVIQSVKQTGISK